MANFRRTAFRGPALAIVMISSALVSIGFATPAHAYDCYRYNTGNYNERLDCNYVGVQFTTGRFDQGSTSTSVNPETNVTVNGRMTDLIKGDGKCVWLEFYSSAFGGRSFVPDSKVCNGESKRVQFYIGDPYTLSANIRLYLVQGANDWNFWSHSSPGARWENIPNLN